MSVYDNIGHEIAQLAYEIYERSGRAGGRDLENWLEAERIVLARRATKEKAEKPKTAPKRKPSAKRTPEEAEPKKTAAKKTTTRKTVKKSS